MTQRGTAASTACSACTRPSTSPDGCTVFVAPGAILLNLPTGRNNERQWRPATDYGIAYRLFDFRIPGTERGASLHLNLAKAWVLAGPGNLVEDERRSRRVFGDAEESALIGGPADAQLLHHRLERRAFQPEPRRRA